MSHAVEVGMLESRKCVTEDLHLHGWMDRDDPAMPKDHVRRYYGSDAAEVDKLAEENPELAEPIHANLGYRGAEVVWAVRHEMARSVEDVLARRTRSLLLDARASIEAAPRVAELMAAELGKDEAWVKDQIAEFEYV